MGNYSSSSRQGHNGILIKNAQGDAESKGQPIRVGNVFSDPSALSKKTEIQLLKERIDREYEELNGRIASNNASPANQTSGFPKDSSGGNIASIDSEKGTPSFVLPVKYGEISPQLGSNDHRQKSKGLPIYDSLMNQNARNDKHRFIERRPIERIPVASPISRRPLEVETQIPVRIPAKKAAEHAPDHARSYSLTDQKLMSKPGYSEAHYAQKLADLIIIEGQSDFSGAQDTTPRKSLSKNESLAAKKQTHHEHLERLAVELHLTEVDRAISDQTKLLVDSKSLAEVVRRTSEEMIRARQSEIAYVEARHKQRVDALQQQLHFERLSFEKLASSLGLSLKHETSVLNK